MANPLLSLAAAAARWLPAPIRQAIYRLGPVSQGLRSALNRAAPSGLVQVEIAGGRLAGVQMLLDLQTEKDYWLGNYEIDLQEAIHDLAHPGMIAYDLGANIGYVSMLMANSVAPGGKVFAFEPLPANQERLRKNMALNPAMVIDLIPKAAAEISGRRQFLVHDSGGMGKLEGAMGREARYEKTIEVECVSLDDFVFKLGNPKPRLIKIDIEGGETLALRGMSRLIEEEKPLLIMELHGIEVGRECWAILARSGYEVSRLTRGYPRIDDVSGLDRKSYILARPKP